MPTGLLASPLPPALPGQALGPATPRPKNAIDQLVTGQAADVHQVMVAVEEAGIALDLMLEIRDRTLEGYQELIRMQV